MKYVIFHLHFYQPPRENPFVGQIEFQDSAYPFENWNERIAFECYVPNVYARIFDVNGYIVNIVNNLEYVSYNFGPTLLHWIKRNLPELYEKILEADKLSYNRLGSGNAIAQAYNHVILPLSNDIDLDVQVYWGLKDFEYHFGRNARGMWLPETAVDLRTLNYLSKNGIEFVILAPHQIKRFRKIGSNQWIYNEGNLPNKPFIVNLDEDRKIIVFAYNSNISHAVSFQDLLSNGERLGKAILSEFREEDDVVVIAADGETYGHHKKFGELGLAYSLYYLFSTPNVKVCNLGYYVDNVEIIYEAEINENTSWSCFHGIGRWKENCGCRFNPNTSQEWRRNLRLAVDSVRNTFEEIYINEMKKMEIDKDIRKNYIEYILKRDNEIKTKEDLFSFVCAFMEDFGIEDCQEAKRVINLLEIYKNIMFAYTSCGWFFDDISGLEATQNLKFLYWAIIKLREIFGINLEPVVETILKDAISNYYGNGLRVFNDFVKTSYFDNDKIVASFIANKLFLKNIDNLGRFWNVEFWEKHVEGEYMISTGKVGYTNMIDFSEGYVNFIFAYLGNLNLYGGFGDFDPSEVFHTLKTFLLSGSFIDIVNFIDEYCQEKFSLDSFFVNVRRKIIRKLIDSNVKEIDRKIDEIFFEQKTIIRNLIDNNYQPIPLEMKLITLLIIDNQIENLMENFNSNYEDIIYFILNREKLDLKLDEEKIKRKFEKKLKNMLSKLSLILENGNISFIDSIIDFINFGYKLGLNYNLWESQNVMFSMYKQLKDREVFFKQLYKEEFENLQRKITSLADMLKIRVIL